jgi:WD40-like Beta Propeller Repeat
MRTSILIAAVLGAVAIAIAAPSAGATSRLGPYFSAPFRVRQNSYTFGQTPSWTRRGDVLSQEDDAAGILQVYRSKLGGEAMRCLTCRAVPGPNGFPQDRPQGDWILFCSYGDQPEHYGNPCLGGYGGDLYVMHPNGTDVTRLTRGSDPNDGADYDVAGGIPYDNYHAYWSPNGRHLVWTRTEAYPLAEGGQRWEIMLADFVSPRHGRPHLAHVRVVGPAYGVYETQHWAPDGSGFLFTAFGPRESPYQSTPPGWMNQQLYFMRLYGRGASPAHPRVTELSDNLPVYQEQAAFTPDMRDVIFMTNRNSPIGSWYDEVIAAAQRTGFDAPDPGSTGTVQFLADFSDPNFRSDLYMLDVRTHDLRELTNFHNVVPEFNWNAGYTKLLWSGIVGGSDHNYITRVASFAGITASERRAPGRIPAPGLYGESIDMSRVTAPAAHADTAGKNVPQTGKDKQALPPVVVTYYALWIQQLKALGAAAGLDISDPFFLTSGR